MLGLSTIIAFGVHIRHRLDAAAILTNLDVYFPPSKEYVMRWLIGFIDAEGNFQVFIDRNYLRVMFRIRLHIDDILVLKLIMAYLHVGQVTIDGNSAVYTISNVDQLMAVLIPLIKKYGLVTTKLDDFNIFVSMVEHLVNSGTSRLDEATMAVVVELIKSINRGRTSYTIIDPSLITDEWLIGFIEGEGTFGIKNLMPYFSIGQHARSAVVLDRIKLVLSSLPNTFNFTQDSEPPVVTTTTNSRTNVISLSVQNIDSLYDYVIGFFLKNPFLSRKGYDFKLWLIVLYLYKWGYAYLPEGRALILKISLHINDGRYSTNPNAGPAPTTDEINAVLALEVLVERTEGINQLEFSKALARTFTRTVYIRDNGVLLNTTPYTSYGDAHQSIGLPRNSRAIGRNIDTGKKFKNRYTFSSRMDDNST